MVFALNKVCKKFNDAKLFDMGLQCRAIIFQHIKDLTSPPTSRLLVLVEKKNVNISLPTWATHTITLDGWRKGKIRCKTVCNGLI